MVCDKWLMVAVVVLLGVTQVDNTLSCSGGPGNCVCEPEKIEFSIPDNSTCSHTLPRGQTGDTRELACLQFGFTGKWLCSEDGRWQLMQPELHAGALNRTRDGRRLFRYLCWYYVSECPAGHIDDLATCFELLSPCLNTEYCPLAFMSCNDAVVLCFDLLDACQNTGSPATNTSDDVIIPSNPATNTSDDVIIPSTPATNTSDDVIIPSTPTTHTSDDVIIPSTPATNTSDHVYSADPTSWYKGCPPGEHKKCKMADEASIISQLEIAQETFQEAINQANTTEEKKVIIKEYLNDSSEVLGKLESQKFEGMEEKTLALSLTIIQENIVNASLRLAALLINETIQVTLQYSESIISRQSPGYFTAENRVLRSSFSRSSSLELPHNFYESYTDAEGYVVVVVTSFRSLHCAANSIPCAPEDAGSRVRGEAQVNTIVFGATIATSRSWTAGEGEAVTARMVLIYKGDQYLLGSPTCVWWNTESNTWSSEGCRVVRHTDQHTDCACNHLTNLAVIMDINGVIGEHAEALRTISLVGCSFSIVCLLVSILCLSLTLTSNKNQSARRLMVIHWHLCVCLLVSEVVLVAGLDATHYPTVCTLVCVLLHYSFLATFTWCAIEGFNIYLMLGKIFQTFNPVKYFRCAGYGLPLVIVATTLLATEGRGYGTKTACWLEPGWLIWSFAGPVLCFMMGNVIFFTFAMVVACGRGSARPQACGRGSARPQACGRGSARPQACGRGWLVPVRLRGSLSIFTMLGITWITGFLYISQETRVMAFLFTVLNSLQGVGIFFATVLMNEIIRKDIASLILFNQIEESCCKFWQGRTRSTVGSSHDSHTVTIEQSPGLDQAMALTQSQ